MFKRSGHFFLLVFIALVLSACSNTPDKDDQKSTFASFATYINFALTLEDTIITAMQTKTEAISDISLTTYQTMVSSEAMFESVVRREALTVDFITLLASPLSINDDYTSIFSFTSDYAADTPFFVMNTLSVNKSYFLVTSSTRLFVPERTVKTLFKDNISLLTAWQRSIGEHKGGHMYINVYELLSDGTTIRVSNGGYVPASQMALLKL